ncbi:MULTISPECIES: hypothetical protein [Rhodococcus]|nr:MULTISPECIES: hypothetical protein [Rhodococcus]KAF0957572.1 hypothetical protein MLGJGCBP_09404 [Rhodococcus sp. T7]KAF0961805.1 hypothetical protein MLGJGCBP_05030 [Rhodococcus sp. T7]UOT08205.1 hypothetical protein MPY17_38355 [Rhodococcus opacus]
MRLRWIAMLAVVLGSLGLSAAPAAAAQPVLMSATINGQDIATADQEHPVRLDPQGSADVSVTITNDSTDPLNVGAIHLSGNVLGLSFFAYHTSVALTVETGATETVTYVLDLTGLDGQATGLINGNVAVIDDSGATIADLPTVTDVRGSVVSVYGLFGLALAILTVLAIVDVALAIGRGRLPLNRWRRGLRLLTPGIGLGLVLVFTLSVARVWVPTTERWITVAAAFAVGFFILGYLTPTPAEDDEDDDEDILDEEYLPDDVRDDSQSAQPPATQRTVPVTRRTLTDHDER